ncbi:DUF6894 family protein [Tianweitania sp.]|uniref:DUF6894 family protein n=1 Tax=Tianweitania sp. TaxID=2021634 RepID=UPI0028986965|nr:hypothetical protein [Tianweitania sp.]
MTRYYFDFHEADASLVDETGLELPDIAAAKRDALMGLLERAAELHDLGLDSNLRLEARTASGNVFSASLSMSVDLARQPSAKVG